jgi:hypothetical protein
MSRQRLFAIAVVAGGALFLLNPSSGKAQQMNTLNEGERPFGNGIGTYGQNPAFSGGYYYGRSYGSFGYQSFYRQPAPSRWEERPDGWMYYWAQGQVAGAYDPENGYWYPYGGTGWGKASTPPWKK